jgi:hypothetical protein
MAHGTERGFACCGVANTSAQAAAGCLGHRRCPPVYSWS